jgi:hypothetical protein
VLLRVQNKSNCATCDDHHKRTEFLICCGIYVQLFCSALGAQPDQLRSHANTYEAD